MEEQFRQLSVDQVLGSLALALLLGRVVVVSEQPVYLVPGKTQGDEDQQSLQTPPIRVNTSQN